MNHGFIAHNPAVGGTPSGGRAERYGRTFGNADSELHRTNIRRSVRLHMLAIGSDRPLGGSRARP